MNWITGNLHGLDWNNSFSDFISQEELLEFIKKDVIDEVVMVEGRIKNKWLEKILNNDIVDSHQEECPSYFIITEKNFKSQHCNQHVY